MNNLSHQRLLPTRLISSSKILDSDICYRVRVDASLHKAYSVDTKITLGNKCVYLTTRLMPSLKVHEAAFHFFYTTSRHCKWTGIYLKHLHHAVTSPGPRPIGREVQVGAMHRVIICEISKAKGPTKETCDVLPNPHVASVAPP
jgi:hypothetical protein